MTYMIDRWNEGDVRFVDGAVGWIMKDGEFRPLMSDAVAELHDAGYISSITVEATAIARDRYVQRTLAEAGSQVGAGGMVAAPRGSNLGLFVAALAF